MINDDRIFLCRTKVTSKDKWDWWWEYRFVGNRLASAKWMINHAPNNRERLMLPAWFDIL